MPISGQNLPGQYLCFMTFVDYLFVFLIVFILGWVSVEALSITPDVQSLVSSGDSALRQLKGDLF